MDEIFTEIKEDIPKIKRNYFGNGSLPKEIVTKVTKSLDDRFGNASRSCGLRIRCHLEKLMSTFWATKNVESTPEQSKLAEKMNRERLSPFLSNLTISDLNNIRITCNNAIHLDAGTQLPKIILSDVDLEEILPRLEKCLISIQSYISKDAPALPEKEAPTAATAPSPRPSAPKYSAKATIGSAEAAALTFFEILEKEITNNNSGFTIDSTTKTSASVNKATSKVWLALDFLVKNGIFRVAIYIPNDSKTRYYDRLIAKKDEIESALGFNPEWLDKGAKSDNTRWIKTEMSFIPHSDSDYKRLAKEALPIIAKYVKVFSLYLPEAFR